jgi:hypothetical protein
MFMKYINSFIYKPVNYILVLAHISNMAFAQYLYAGTTESNARMTLSGIDGSGSYTENVCPGFTLCFDLFSFGGNQTQKADMFWDNGIPSAAFIVSNDAMPTGHFCWTPSASDARTAPYIFHVTMKSAADEKTFTYAITVPVIRAEIITTDISCFGNSDGSAVVSVTGGSGNYTYLWSNNAETTVQVNGLNPGNYNVQVMDENGCEVTASARILSPKPLVLDAVSQPATCIITGGEAEITASGGTMPYTYSWLPGDASSERIGHLPSGVYTSVVTDANGCTAYKQVNISSLTATYSEERKEMIASEGSMSNVLIYPNPTHDMFTVKNISDATVTVTVVNALGQVVYNTINIPANLSAGIPMDDQANGLYLVKVQQRSTVEMVKLIKE